MPVPPTLTKFGEEMRSAALRAYDEAVQELGVLQGLLESGIHVKGVSAERAFRQGLQRIGEYCHDCPDVLEACRTARTAAVRAFAAPGEMRNVMALARALSTLADELHIARGGDSGLKV